MMRNTLTALASGAALTLTAGCACTVTGAPVPTRDSAGILGVGRTIGRVLPNDAELSAVLNDNLSSHGFPPIVGGVTALPNGIRDSMDASEIECLGVTSPDMRAVYEKSSVRAVATEDADDWDDPNHAVGHSYSVNVGAMALTSPADAHALFATFVNQWQQCQGKTMTVYQKPGGSGDQLHQISVVHTAGDVLTAVVMLSVPATHTEPIPEQRAVGVAMNCIVDVDFSDSGWRNGDPISADQAVAVAEQMLAKVPAAS